ncbi:response regulator transcription factor [Actinosynnema sp. NPDC051121]
MIGSPSRTAGTIGRAPGPPALGVVAVEGNPLVREGLRDVLRRAGLRWIGATSTPRVPHDVRVDVVLVDSALDPNAALIRTLVRGRSTPTVLALVDDVRPTSDFPRVAEAAGAHGLVSLRAEPVALVTAILRAHHARRSSARTPAPATPDATRPPAALSPRQLQVLTLIADGLTAPDIAGALAVGTETVRTHIKGLLQKLGAKDRTHAVSIAYRTGVLPPPPRAAARPRPAGS